MRLPTQQFHPFSLSSCVMLWGLCLLILGIPATLTYTVTAAATPGVQTTFYADRYLLTPVATRTDSQINFAWGSSAPQAEVPQNDFSARFAAYLTVPVGGQYRLVTTSDDGVILFFNGHQVIYDWTMHGESANSSAPLILDANTPYPLELFYFQAIVEASVKLWLEPVGGERVLVPAAYFTLPDATFPFHDLTTFNFTQTDEAGNLLIYTDELAPNWHNWSWATVNLAYTATTHSGVHAVLMDLDGWSAFNPFFSNGQNWANAEYRGLSTHDYDRLSFWVQRGASAGGQTVNVQVSDRLPGWEWRHRATFTVPTDDAWQQVIIPLSDVDAVDTLVTRLAWVGNGAATAPILIDEVKLLKRATPTTVVRDPLVNDAEHTWLFRDERHSVLSTSWDTEIVYQSTIKGSGAFGLGARFRWYSGLQFRPLDYQWDAPAPFQWQTANVWRFLINRGGDDAPDQRYELYAVDAAGAVTRKLDLNDYLSGGPLDSDLSTWQLATIPLDALQPADGPASPLYAVGIQEMSGINGATGFLYLDEVRFEHQAASGDQLIYHDALAAGWANWSWQSTVDFAQASPVQTGSAALAITYDQPWAGLYLHTDTPINPIGLNLLHFGLHGGAQGGQQVRVLLVDAANKLHTDSAVVITPPANGWTTIEIPLTQLGYLPQISGIIWQDTSGSAQPTFYLDEVALIQATLPPTPTPTPVAGPVLQVDAAAHQHPISPYIYGINFADEALAADLRLPIRRWGGNATTRYNWQNDTANRTSDWYFENIPETNAEPATLPDGSAVDRFIEQDRRTGTASLITLPLIGWTPKQRDYACGFSVAKYGPQQSTDPWRSDCGNGLQADGSPIIGNDPTDTSLAIDPSFVQGWIEHLQARYGTAATGGVQFYNLDNEPMLWNSTHRDVHPQPVSYDELRDRTYQYGAAIKAVDPAAKTLGPVLWGWTAYFYSALDAAGEGAWWNNPVDRNAHGGLPFVVWYLQQMQAYEAQHGVRLLDYLDLHYYPQASGVALAGAGNAATQALRLRSTRGLWDPTYVDESWINEAVRLLPRMREWVDQNYPGTQVAITEYNWGALDHINGALAQADVLGIFGREGLDLATLWAPPKATQPGAFAFRLYRNYDGAGSAFGEQSVSATSSDQGQLAIYGARRSRDGALTLILINKTNNTLNSTLTLANFTPSAQAQVYRYSGVNLTSIVHEPDLAMSGNPVSLSVPGTSMTLLVLPPATVIATPTPTGTATTTATPTATPTATTTPTATPQPTMTPTPASNAKRIIGYYLNNGAYTVAQIPADKVTHINYAFANISAAGDCSLGDQEDNRDDEPYLSDFTALNTLKQNHPHLKTLLSVGGWSWSDHFSNVAATPASRQRFAQSCVQMMQQYGFDGLDIDWEFPVVGGEQPGTPADKSNFTFLLAEIRSQLDTQGTRAGRTYLLTIAAPSTPYNAQYLELDQISRDLDWINVMAYDFHGAWSDHAGFNAPLTWDQIDPDGEQLNVAAAIRIYLDRGIAADKIVLGVPFYGIGWRSISESDHGRYQPATAATAFTVSFRELEKAYLPTYPRYWSEAARVPWLYDAATGTLISYDDAESLGHKVNYINNEKLGGVMIWQLSQDDSAASLLTALTHRLYQAGDGNGDGQVDAGDISACVLELFDGDGNFWLAASGGTFTGTPGCDANQDTHIDAGDLTCTALIIFNGPGACGF